MSDIYIEIEAPGGQVVTGITNPDPAPFTITAPQIVSTIALPHTWAISGDISATNTVEHQIPSFFVSVPLGQTVKIVGLACILASGGPTTARILKNGIAIPLLDNFQISTISNKIDPLDINLANHDLLQLEITDAQNQPRHMTVSLFIQYTV